MELKFRYSYTIIFGENNTMETDLLTYRLTDFMNQIAANQIAEMVNREKLQNEQLMSQDERSRLMVNNQRNVANKAKKASFKDIMSINEIEKEPETSSQEDKMKQPRKIGSLWTVSRSFKNNLAKSKELEKVVPQPKAKFLRAAKIAVMISQVKQGRVICTCSSLDAKCSIHDV